MQRMSIDQALLGADSIRQVRTSVDGVYWLAGLADQDGRVTIRRWVAGEVTELTPQANVRSRVMEYGGGAYAVADGMVAWCDDFTSRLWVYEGDRPRPLTAESTRFRYGGLSLVPESRLLLAVREDHDVKPEERTEIVALNLDSENPDGGRVLVTGADFYAGPTVHDGQLAWFEWRHPNMSWDAAGVYVAPLSDPGNATAMQDEAGVSAQYPLWLGNGTLVWASDASGQWNWNSDNGRPWVSPNDCSIPVWVLNAPPACAVDEAEVAGDPTEKIDRVEARRLDRSSQLALAAGLEAWVDAGFSLGEDNMIDPERLSVCVGTGIGGLHSLLGNWDVQKEKGLRRVSPFTIPMLMANAPAANLGLRFGAAAAVHAPVSACASSNEAISLGLDQIRLGRCDIAVVGGTEGVIHPLPINAFAQMQALSRRNDDPAHASRPWDTGRDGFVLGEGSVILVIETLEHAKARGAKIYGTIAGAGISNDNHDMVQPEPTGRGQSAAMVKALRASGLEPVDVAHVNAHGTSTPQGDTTEANSIAAALGKAVDNCIVTSTKSMTGHLLGGAGAMETFATVMALKERVVPPTINIEDLEQGLPIDIAVNKPRQLPNGGLAAINNSFGFGGSNVAIAVTNANITS